jgi:DNA polymerase III delta prime subunit
MNSDHTLWVEKYRPDTLQGYIGNDVIVNKIKTYIEGGDIPHLLFYGRAGTGKTTLAKIVINNIECDYLYINASDENNVDTVRNKIRDFSSSAGFSTLKVVILDEADFMTPNAQAALRNLMETFSKHTRFILTCNYIEKIIDPIQSRCQVFAITPPSKKDVAERLLYITHEENIPDNTNAIVHIVRATYPDIRRSINSLQRQIVNGNLVTDQASAIAVDYMSKVIEELKGARNFNTIRKIIADSQVKTFEDLYRFLFENIDEFASTKLSNCIVIIAEAQYQDTFVVDKEINIMAMFSKILTTLEK